MPNYNLSVLLTTRDRPILTQKVIESLHENSKVFEEIDIYVFDNLSLLDDNRLKLFQDMLKDGIIKYYSFDTKTSLNECFGKAVAFKRWGSMIEDIQQVNIKRNERKLREETRYYVLIDSDMLLGSGWDEYFISAMTQIPKEEPHIHYLVQWPGGIPRGAREQARHYPAINAFTGDQFSLGIAGFGGGSGFWFMTYDMLQSMRWNHSDLALTFKHFKKHDTTTWNKIRKKIGPHDKFKYVCGVMLPDDKDPVVLHLGGQIGSICNSESRVSSNYERDRKDFFEREKYMESIPINELFESYKNKCNIW